MPGWLAHARQALRVAVDRSDLWLAGAVIAFAGAGWIVLLGTVAPTPDAADMASLGLQLAASPWWPWNVVVLGVALVSGLASLLLVIAFGEVAIVMGLSDLESEPSLTVPRAFGTLALAALPVGALALLVGWLAAPGFVSAVTAPSGDTPLLLRILQDAWLLLVVFGLAVVVAQAFAASRLHRSSPSGSDIDAGWRRPSRLRLVVQAAVTLAAFLAFQLATAVTLFVLWQPLQSRLERAGLAEPTTLVLLLGFVWIWLVLLILAGVIQAWITAWWGVELGSEPGG